jgi:hypothetical protein
MHDRTDTWHYRNVHFAAKIIHQKPQQLELETLETLEKLETT